MIVIVALTKSQETAQALFVSVAKKSGLNFKGNLVRNRNTFQLLMQAQEQEVEEKLRAHAICKDEARDFIASGEITGMLLTDERIMQGNGMISALGVPCGVLSWSEQEKECQKFINTLDRNTSCRWQSEIKDQDVDRLGLYMSLSVSDDADLEQVRETVLERLDKLSGFFYQS